MKITLIYPAVGRKEHKKYIKSWKMEPLPLMTIAALTPSDVEIIFFDDRIEQINYEEKTDLVAINIEAYSALRGYEIASKYKKRGIPVIFGGYHATLMPDEIIGYGYSVLVGEAENLWPDVIKDLKNKNLKKIYKADQRPIFGNVLPRRDIIKSKKYTPVTLIETSRGCNYNCNFCSIHSFFKSTYSFRSSESIIKEIESNDSKVVFFVDDNIICDQQRAEKLFIDIKSCNIKWVSQFSIDKANDENLLRNMKKSGCEAILIGFESLDINNLRQMGKKWNNNFLYETAIKKLRNNGISIYATFLFGYDNDTEDTFKRTHEFALNNKLFMAAFNHLQPFPGTQCYNYFKKNNLLLYDSWWLDPNYEYGKIVFRPKNFSASYLEAKCIEIRKNFYSLSSIMNRGFDFKFNCNSILKGTSFLIQNFLARKEVNEKWGLPLGKNLDVYDK